jgi:hypothetical protein
LSLIFRARYAMAAAAIFAIEVLIALFAHDALIRPYGGDALAVVLVYAGLRAVTPLRVVPAILATLAIAFGVEFGQYIGLLDLLGWRGNRLAAIVLGSDAEWRDVIAYTAGALATLLVERWRNAR